MARLTIEQVAAPDFSSTSDILANAGKAFDSGIESAKGLLGKYQEGQATKNDNAVLNDIAKLGSEDELNAYLNSDALMGKTFSPDMQKTILGLRKGVLGYGQDRANIDSTTSATGRLNAAEGRTNADWVDGNNVRDERRKLTPYLVDAAEEGRRFGVGGSTGGSGGVSADNPVFSEFMGTVQASGVTNPYALAAIAATGSHESGFSAKNAAGSWSDPSESGRPGTAGGVMSWNNERFDAMRNFTGGDLSGAAQAKYFLAEDPQLIAALNNAKSPEEAISLMNNAWRFAGYNKEGGEAGARAETTRGLVGMFNNGKNFPVTEAQVGGNASAALADAIRGSLYMEPDEAVNFLQTGWTAQKDGQAAIDAAERKRIDTNIAEGTVAAIQDPNNLTDTAVTGAVLSLGGNIPAADRLAAAGTAGDLARGSFAGIVKPNVAPDPGVSAALTAANERDAAAANVDPSIVAVQAAETFEASGDVAKALIDSAGGLAEESGLDKTYVSDQIKKIAADNGITEAQAAATLDNLRTSGISVEDALTGNSPEMNEAINTRAQDLYGPEALEAASQKRLETQKASDSRAAAELQLSTAQSRAAKLPAGSPERERAEAQVSNLKDTLLSQKTPQELDQLFTDYVRQTGMASRLEGLSPEDPDFGRAMMQLEEVIRVDKSLSQGEKELLIKKLRG